MCRGSKRPIVVCMADLHFEIPADLPVHDHGVDVDTSTAKNGHQEHHDTKTTQKVDSADAQKFLATSGLLPLLNELLLDLYLEQPEDPIDYMTKWCLRYVPSVDPADEPSHARRNAQLASRHAEAVAYSAKYKLPVLFDELLTGMIVEKPEEPSRFAMSWLRWRKKVFIQQHRPLGYAAFLASLDAK